MIHYSVVNLWKYAVLQIYPSVSYSLHSVSTHYQIKISKGGEEGGGNERFVILVDKFLCCVCVCGEMATNIKERPPPPPPPVLSHLLS